MNTSTADFWLQGLQGKPVIVYHRDRQWQGLLDSWDDTVLLLSMDDKHQPNLMVQRGPGVCVRSDDPEFRCGPCARVDPDPRSQCSKCGRKVESVIVGSNDKVTYHFNCVCGHFWSHVE